MGKKATLNNNLGDWEPVSSQDSTSEWEPISAPAQKTNIPSGPSAYEQALSGQTGIDKFKQTIANIPDMDEGKKKIVEDVALRGLRGKELSDVILTLQGKHPHQEGNTKYYLDDKGVPKPLKNSERPPVGHEVASIWGTQKEANDDAWYTDLAKTVYNVIPSTVENIVDLAQTGYELAADKESEWLNTLKNSANYLKMAKDEDLNKSLFNTQGIDEWKDLADKERWDFSPETVWGTVNSLLGSVGEFAAGGAGAASIAGKATKATQLTGAVLTNLGEVRDAATEAGLTGRDRAIFTAAVAPVVSAIDVKWGLANKIVNNPAAEAEKKAFLKALGKGLAKDAEGNFTKEALDELPKLTTVGYAQVAKQIGKLTTKDVLQEGGQEAAQAFIQNAGEQLWDKLTPEEKKKFGTDAFSPESFGEYIQNGLAGLLGGAPTVVAVNQAKQLAKNENQDLNAFELAKKGDKAVDAFKQNVDLEVKRGNLTPQEGANAVFKVEAFKQYHDQLGDVKMPEEDKFKILRMSFEKANLESQIPTKYEEEKLNPIEQAKIDVKRKEAKAMQDEITNLIQRHVTLNKETVASEKIVSDVDKEMTDEKTPAKEGEMKFSKGVEDLIKRHRFGQFKEETIKSESKQPSTKLNYQGTAFEDITPLQWNEKKHRDSERFKYLVNKLTTENDVMPGNLSLPEDSSTYDTIKIELPGQKFVSTASSARDLNTQVRGHFRTERAGENIHSVPVVIKPIQLTTGRTVLGVYSEENGKFLSYVREHDTGKSQYSEKEIEELQHMQASSKLTKFEVEGYKTKREASAQQQPVAEVKPKEKFETEVKPKKEKVVKVTDEEAKRIKKEVNAKPNTFEEAVLRYFLHNGRITAKDFTRYTGFGGKTKEFKQRIWAYNKTAPNIDNLVKALWMEDLDFPEDNFDETKLINDFFAILERIPGKRAALSQLLDAKKRNVQQAEQYASPEAIAYAEQLEEDEKLINTRELTDEEVEDMLARDEYREEYYKYYSEKFDDNEGFTEEDKLQKQSTKKGNINTIVDTLQKAMPKVKVEFDDSIDAAGRWSPKNNTITINPYYAGLDTPIHEYAHVFIDAIGLENKVIKAAIEQLKNTQLWADTKNRYPELDENNLAKEVLAEAIGLEGANIFDKESEKSQFMKYLEYIYNWLKNKLGLNKNTVNSLAKQILAGIGTKEMMGEAQGKTVSLQLPSGEKINGVEVMPEVVNGFYSKLEKQLLQMKLDKAPAKQWNDKLKSEEAKWTGLSDWLAEKGQTAVTRQEIKNFLKNNRISLVEVSKKEDYKIVPLNFNKSKNWNFDDFYFARDSYFDYDNGEEMISDVWEDDEVGYKIMRDANDIYYVFDKNGNELTPPEINEGTAAPYFDNFNEAKDAAEKALAEDNKRSNTKYHQYQLPGDAENYRELLITMPSTRKKVEPLTELPEEYEFITNGKKIGVVPVTQNYAKTIDGWYDTEKEALDSALRLINHQRQEAADKQIKDYKSSHWEEPNILVHLRMNERTDAEGNKVLFLEEVQSDWGQEGKKRGFADPNKAKWEARRLEIENKGKLATKEEQAEWLDIVNNKLKPATTPSAPFVTDTNAWVKLGLKYALKQAVESGATKIAWTTGEQQNERYDLSKQVSKIAYNKETETLWITDKKTNRIETQNVPKDKLADNVGKDLAEKILNDQDYFTTYEGVDLKIGGKGMKGFYDKILPDVFKSLVKELTGKPSEIGNTEIKKLGSQMSITITPELAKAVGAGMPMFQKNKPKQRSEEEVQPIFEQLMNLFHEIKDSETTKKKRILAQQRRDLLKANPDVAYIEENIESIYNQLKDAGEIELEGDCV